MRTLTVGNMYPPHHLGGYEIVWRSSVVHLRRQGHEVRILTTEHRQPGVPESAEADVHRELRWYWREHEFPRLGLGERLAIERHNAAVLDRHLAELRPDVVAWWAMGGMSLSLIEAVRRRGLPAVAIVCDAWLLYGPRADGWQRFAGRRGVAAVTERLTGIPARLELGRLGPFLFPSEAVRGPAVQRWAIADSRVAHQGVDHGLFRPAAERRWGGELLYAGRIDPRKGIAAAILALGGLEDARLTIIGAGDPTHIEELRALAQTNGVEERVTFRGPVERAKLVRAYAAADAVLFPVMWEEPWGLVPLEAMAVGRPVIATGRGGSGEYLVDGRNCLLFDPDRDGLRGLAAAVNRLADDPDLRRRLREGGFETSRSYSDRDFDLAAEETLERALEGAGS
jgi:glycogen(starch) synthase